MIQRVLVFSVLAMSGSASGLYDYKARNHPVIAREYMVATQDRHATEAGLEIMRRGGNFADAAVASAFALAVTHPQAGNLAGGGFAVIHAKSGTRALDFRETAPASASPEMFLDGQGNPDPAMSQFSLKSTGVPGTPAGLYTLHRAYGRLPWKDCLTPAIRLAEKGFSTGYRLHSDITMSLSGLSAEARAVFAPGGRVIEPGTRLIQKELARVLQEIATGGPDAFYKGRFARELERAMKAGEGLIRRSDMLAYQVKWRDPVCGTFYEYTVCSMPPPSSGGIHLLQILKTLEYAGIREIPHLSARYIQLVAEASRNAYADRSVYLGDPDFTPVPVKELLDSDLLKARAQEITAFGFRAGREVKPANLDTRREKALIPEGDDTTHLTVMDRDGNTISMTVTLNFSFGNGRMVSGVLLNNQMDDFSAKPGARNAYGLIGSVRNEIRPGKRMLSSMTPAIGFRNAQPVFATGSPGGARIITTVLQSVLNVSVGGMNCAEAVAAPRFHHQWIPDSVRLERGFSPDTIQLLEDAGYRLQVQETMGSVQMIERRDGFLRGATDLRSADGGIGGR